MINETPNPETPRESFAPCPFCGKTPKLVRRDVEPQGDSWYGKRIEEFVLCECGACLFDGFFHEGFYDAKTRALIAWNTRARASNNVQTNDNALKPNESVSRPQRSEGE